MSFTKPLFTSSTSAGTIFLLNVVGMATRAFSLASLGMNSISHGIKRVLSSVSSFKVSELITKLGIAGVQDERLVRRQNASAFNEGNLVNVPFGISTPSAAIAVLLAFRPELTRKHNLFTS